VIISAQKIDHIFHEARFRFGVNRAKISSAGKTRDKDTMLARKYVCEQMIAKGIEKETIGRMLGKHMTTIYYYLGYDSGKKHYRVDLREEDQKREG
jgi:hypothetical protein